MLQPGQEVTTRALMEISAGADAAVRFRGGEGVLGGLTAGGIVCSVEPRPEDRSDACLCKFTSSGTARPYGVVEIFQAVDCGTSRPVPTCRRPERSVGARLGLLEWGGMMQNSVWWVRFRGQGIVAYDLDSVPGGTLDDTCRLGAKMGTDIAQWDPMGAFRVLGPVTGPDETCGYAAVWIDEYMSEAVYVINNDGSVKGVARHIVWGVGYNLSGESGDVSVEVIEP